MKTQELVNGIVNDFLQTMENEGFETFIEMRENYWWESQDIKNEVDYIVTKELNIPNDGEYNYYVDDMDEDLNYNKLIRMVYKELKNKNKYGEIY